MHDSLRIQARFLFAMGIVGCHSASPDPNATPAPTTTTTIPASSTSAAAVAVSNDGGLATATNSATAPSAAHSYGGGISGPPPGLTRTVLLPDGGVRYERMPFLGRPLRIEHESEMRVADRARRDDWTTPLLPATSELTKEERTALAESWARDAASEHASIASFSRLSLQLLALGAPADLIEAAHAAALDEVRHARDAYAIASAYAGEAVGPATLDIRGALEHVADVTLAELAVETFEDGCIAETIAAWDAREKIVFCNDSVVRDVLVRIADDEERHAELAWRVVAWAVRTGGDNVQRALKEAVARATRSNEISQNGLFSSVITPCAHALLAIQS